MNRFGNQNNRDANELTVSDLIYVSKNSDALEKLNAEITQRRNDTDEHIKKSYEKLSVDTQNSLNDIALQFDKSKRQAEELLANARKEADELLAKAKVDAAAITTAAQQTRDQLVAEATARLQEAQKMRSDAENLFTIRQELLAAGQKEADEKKSKAQDILRRALALSKELGSAGSASAIDLTDSTVIDVTDSTEIVQTIPV